MPAIQNSFSSCNDAPGLWINGDDFGLRGFFNSEVIPSIDLNGTTDDAAVVIQSFAQNRIDPEQVDCVVVITCTSVSPLEYSVEIDNPPEV